MKFKKAWEIEEPKEAWLFNIPQIGEPSPFCQASINYMQVSLLMRGYLYHSMFKI
jgi:hypothetical protein